MKVFCYLLLLFLAFCVSVRSPRSNVVTEKNVTRVTKAEAKRRALVRAVPNGRVFRGRRLNVNGSMPFSFDKIGVTECHSVGALKAQRSPLLAESQASFVNNVTKSIQRPWLFQADLFVLVLFYKKNVKYLNKKPFL